MTARIIDGKIIAAEIIPQVAERLKFLDRVGLSYLTLERSADTLSGGEAQRIRLAAAGPERLATETPAAEPTGDK